MVAEDQVVTADMVNPVVQPVREATLLTVQEAVILPALRAIHHLHLTAEVVHLPIAHHPTVHLKALEAPIQVVAVAEVVPAEVVEVVVHLLPDADNLFRFIILEVNT